MKTLAGISLLLWFTTPAHAVPVNCGKALAEAKIPSCIAMEQVGPLGCKKDPLIPKGQRWAGKAQTKEAAKFNGKDAAECIQNFSLTFSKDGCCRRDLPKFVPKKKLAKATKTPARPAAKPAKKAARQRP